MKKGDKAAIVGCSNGRKLSLKPQLDQLGRCLSQLGLVPVFSDFIYERESVFSGSARERAESLMSFYRDGDVKAIFDISGGDIANEILPFLDYTVIEKSDKLFWGYSDLTTVINAIYAKTGRKSVLYQIRNLVNDHGENQVRRFTGTVLNGTEDLFAFQYEFLQQKEMEGIVAGGNIRCLLKLAGTEYWPDMDGKILLLEALGGSLPQMVTYLSQLKQMGVFEKVAGILLGTFTKMEEDGCVPVMADLVKEYAGPNLPIAATREIGHGDDAKGIVIGARLRLELSPY